MGTYCRKCDRYVDTLEGESPLRTLVRRTVREGKGVHREVESEESRIQNADLTNRMRIRGRGSLDKDALESEIQYLPGRSQCICNRLAGECIELPGESCIHA